MLSKNVFVYAYSFIFMFVDVLHPDESPTVNAEGDKPIDETSRNSLTKAKI